MPKQSALSPETMQEIIALANDMTNIFAPPELIPGCEVLSVTDKDEYDTDNGWIEAICGKHNNQRCRWKAKFANVQVGDYVDVLYFGSIKLFEVFAKGGDGDVNGLPITTKGDLLGFSTLTDRYPASGNDGWVLTEDSTADFGFAWKEPVAIATYYLHTEASDIGGYEQAQLTPADDAEVEEITAVTAGTSPALIDPYVSYPTTGVGKLLIDAGVWTFNIWGKVDSVATGNSTISCNVYKRDTGGTETLLFSVETPALTTSAALYSPTSVQSDIPLALTDRLVFKFYANTTSVPSRNVYFYYEGTTRYTHIDTPLQVPITAGGGNVWPLPGEANIGATSYATISDGIDALGSGDQLIIGEGSYTTDWTGGHAGIPTGADVKGSGVDVTVLTDADSYVLEVEGESLVEQLTVSNTTTTGATALLQDSGGNGRYDTVKAKSTATSGTAIGFYIFDGDAVLINCEGEASGGGTNRALYGYDSGTGTTIEVRDGKYTGDVVADQAGCTIHLDGPTITGSVTEANSGTITGHYYDASGNHIFLSGSDVYPTGMERGITPRLSTVAGDASNLITHHRGETLASGQTWQGSPFTTPGSVTNAPDDYLSVYHTTGFPARGFASLPITNAAASWQNKGCFTRVSCGVEGQHGLRIDVGDDTTYAEIYVDGSAGDGTISITFRYRINSGSVTTTTSNVVVPLWKFLELYLFQFFDGSDYYIYGYIWESEISQVGNLVGFFTPAITAYVPAAGRYGYLASADAAQNPGFFDYLISTFT